MINRLLPNEVLCGVLDVCIVLSELASLLDSLCFSTGDVNRSYPEPGQRMPIDSDIIIELSSGLETNLVIIIKE